MCGGSYDFVHDQGNLVAGGLAIVVTLIATVALHALSFISCCRAGLDAFVLRRGPHDSAAS